MGTFSFAMLSKIRLTILKILIVTNDANDITVYKEVSRILSNDLMVGHNKGPIPKVWVARS